MKKLVYVGTLFLVACATSTGITPIGEDTYMISRNGAGFWTATATIKAEAYGEANQYCASQGKKFQVVRASEHAASGRPGDFPGAEIQFMCLDAKDRELVRPKMKREADAIVEIKKDIRTQDDTAKPKDVYAELIKLDDLKKKGKEKFEQICAACHGAEGKGNPALGAPNLTDKVWLHGSGEAILETISRGRVNQMPAHKDILTPAKIHLLTAYVYSLSGK